MKKHIALVFLLAMIGMPVQASASDYEVHGSVTAKYRFQGTGQYRYNSVEPLATLDLGNSAMNHISASVQGGGFLILNGHDAASPFWNIYDTFDAHAVGRLYHAYVNFQDVGPLNTIRVGRQHRYDFEALYYDGATFETKPFANFTLTAFGGMPVHMYENQIGSDPGDWVVGTALQWRPLERFQVRFDYVHVRDKPSYFQANLGTREDNLFGGSVWWDINKYVSLKADISAFSNVLRDTSVLATLKFPAHDLNFQLKAYRLLKPYGPHVIDFDMFNFESNLQAFTEFTGTVYKGFGKHVAVQLGGSSRQLDAYQVANAYNNGYLRAFSTVTLMDLIARGLTLSATGDYYSGQNNEVRNNYFGGTFSATQKFLKERLRATLGTTYYYYAYNLYTGNQSNNVQNYYAQVRAKLIGGLEGRLGYRFEHSVNNFHTADARLTWSF